MEEYASTPDEYLGALTNLMQGTSWLNVLSAMLLHLLEDFCTDSGQEVFYADLNQQLSDIQALLNITSNKAERLHGLASVGMEESA